MDLIASILEALPVAATHPFAFVGYVLVVIVWGVLSWRTSRNKQILSQIEKIPAKDRLEALRLEMGGVELKEGLTPEQWLVHRQRLYIFIGFLVLCMLAVLIFTIAGIEGSKLESSKKELIGILKLREKQTTNIIDETLKSQQLAQEVFMGTKLVNNYREKKKEADALRAIRSELIRINGERIEALRKDKLVLMHELGIELVELRKKIVQLIESSTGRTDDYRKLYDMSKFWSIPDMERAQKLLLSEKHRIEKLQALNNLISESSKLEP